MKKKILGLICLIFLIVNCIGCNEIENKSTDINIKGDVPRTRTVEEDNNMEISNSTIFEHEIIESSSDTPIELGSWGNAYKYSALDKEYHKVNISIDEIIRDQTKVEMIIDEYKNEKHTIELKEINEDLEYCIVKYNIYLPSDFFTEPFGVTPKVDMEIVPKDSKGIEVGDQSYVGLSNVIDLSTNNIFSENYGEGRALFVMVKGYENYILKIGAYGYDNMYVKGK